MKITDEDYLEMEIDGIDIYVFEIKFQDNMKEAEIFWNYATDKRSEDENFDNTVCEAVNTLIREIDIGKHNFKESSTQRRISENSITPSKARLFLRCCRKKIVECYSKIF